MENTTNNALPNTLSNSVPVVDISANIKDSDFHTFLKQEFGDKAEPFINWAKNTQLEGKITPSKLEKLVLLYEGKVDFDLVTKAVVLDEEVKKEISDVFAGKAINTLPSDKKSSVDISEGIKNGDFHIVLKEQFGENANPFIDWAKNTKLEDKITPIKLEKLVLLYEDGVEFNLVEKAVSLNPEVRNEMFNIFEDKKMNAQLSSRKPKI